MTSTLIQHAFVVTMNPERHLITDGAVLIQDDRIAAVGKTDSLAGDAKPDRVIDATGKMVLPGLIDGHNHPGQYLSKGIADDVHIFTWMYERVYPYEAHLTPEDVYVGAVGNFAEMLRTGTTCFVDPGGYHVDAVGEAARETGIRGILSRSTRDLDFPRFRLPRELFESTEDAVRHGEELVQRWHGAENDRIRAWFGLRYVYNVSDELCRQVKVLADRHGVGIHAHAAAGKEENKDVQEIWGKRSLERFHDLGLFGPNLYLIHMGWPDEREQAWLKEFDVKVIHCPSASMHGAYGNIGNRQFPGMLARGITIGLGTDSATAGRFLDMVRVMYLAACAHKDAWADPQLMGAYTALEMATIGGARACLWDDQIGSLEVGKRADLLVVDMSGPEWWPMRDPIANFIYGADGHSVELVMVDGRVLVEGGQVTVVDHPAVARRAAAAADALMERAGIQVPSRWPVL